MLLIEWAVWTALLAQTPSSLNSMHERWLTEEAIYIITDEERERFLGLNGDEERERFIASFWDVRDPVPETVVNEYREEHYRRISEANRSFSRETARDGWRTDRGRMFVLLGPANDVQHYPNPRDLYPMEVWHYYNLDIPDLPPALDLLFFKRRGIGEYRLFSPAFDGLSALVAGHQLQGLLGNPFRPPPAYLLQFMDRDILEASQRVAPGYNAHSSEQVIADLLTPGIVHQRLVTTAEGRVTAEVTLSSRMMTASLVHHAFPGDYGFTETHFAVEVPANQLSFTKYPEAYRGRVDVFVTVQDAEGNRVEELDDAAAFEFSPDGFEEVRGYPFLYQRKLLLLPGRYLLQVLLRDSVTRRVALVDRELQVASFPEDRPAASSVVLAYKVDDTGGNNELPYRFADAQYFPKVDGTFSLGQPVYAFVDLSLPQSAAGGETRVTVSYRLRGTSGVVREGRHDYRKSSLQRGRSLPILIPLSTEGLAAGVYDIEVEIQDDAGAFLDEARAELRVGDTASELGRLMAESAPDSDPARTHFTLGMKYYYAGAYEDAAQRFQSALAFDPSHASAKLYLGRSRALEGRCDEALKLLDEVVSADPERGEAHAGRGYCLFQLDRFADAAAAYRKALHRDPEQTSLLNALGQSELKAGNRPAAVDAFTRSLELDPEQTEVKAFLDQIGRQ